MNTQEQATWGLYVWKSDTNVPYPYVATALGNLNQSDESSWKLIAQGTEDEMKALETLAMANTRNDELWAL